MGEYIVNPGEKPLTSLGIILYNIAPFLVTENIKIEQHKPYQNRR